MGRNLVYDLPTRLFHWLFALTFLTAFFIAKTIDDDSPVYFYHMLAGLLLGFLVILRTLWGFLGTKHSLFSGFSFNPSLLFSYFLGILKGEKKRWIGHNPATSWVAIIMMIMALGLGVTGYLMTTRINKEDFEDLHELLANGFIILVILHISGVIIHTLRYKEMIALSMIDGKKLNAPPNESIPNAKNGVGVIFIGLVIAFIFYLFMNYDSQNRSLRFFQTTLQLEGNIEE